MIVQSPNFFLLFPKLVFFFLEMYEFQFREESFGLISTSAQICLDNHFLSKPERVLSISFV